MFVSSGCKSETDVLVLSLQEVSIADIEFIQQFAPAQNTNEGFLCKTSSQLIKQTHAREVEYS